MQEDVELQETKDQGGEIEPEVRKKESKVKKESFYATGRRKLSTARVRLLTPGNGTIAINKRPFESFFARETHRLVIQQPLKLVQLLNKLDVRVNVRGGGETGQAEATRHGISRALVKLDNSLRIPLKKAGFLTRDARAKERKKYGRKRARKRFQYSKR